MRSHAFVLSVAAVVIPAYATAQATSATREYPKALVNTAWSITQKSGMDVYLFYPAGRLVIYSLPARTDVQGNRAIRYDLAEQVTHEWWVHDGNALCMRPQATTFDVCDRTIVSENTWRWLGMPYSRTSFRKYSAIVERMGLVSGTR
jgi:hypothetical protein